MPKANKEMLDVFRNHAFNFLWEGEEPVGTEALRNAIYRIETIAADRIFQNEPDPAPQSDLEKIFMPYHQNGTFMIGERFATSTRPSAFHSKAGTEFGGPFSHSRKIAVTSSDIVDTSLQPPAFIRNEVAGFEAWARTIAYQDLLMMEYEGALPMALSDDEKTQTVEAVLTALQYPMSDGKRLYSVIPNQNYIDYFRRATSLFLSHQPNTTFITESRYDTISKEVSIAIIDRYLSQFVNYNDIDINALKKLMVIAILSGSMGLDMKCSHCAASDITIENTVFFDDGQRGEERIKKVYRWLVQKAHNGIDVGEDLFEWNRYMDLVLRKPCNLVFFPDDYGETVFDLFQLQAQLIFNKRLHITVIPRAEKYHNDASFQDVENLLKEPCFELLRRFRDSGRIYVSEYGPRNGGVEGPKISRRSAYHVLAADVLYIKGSRSYELLATGIKVPTFAGQVVNREFSESVTGVDMRSGIPILRYFLAFPDFWGFKERHLRNDPLVPTGRRGWQASMTAVESARATGSAYFRRLSSNTLREQASLEIMEEAMGSGIAPHVVAAAKRQRA